MSAEHLQEIISHGLIQQEHPQDLNSNKIYRWCFLWKVPPIPMSTQHASLSITSEPDATGLAHLSISHIGDEYDALVYAAQSVRP